MSDDSVVTDQKAKRKSKDSVFTKLFSDTGNILELYKQLHPEDKTVTEKDIQLQTISTVLINDIYNDLGFIVNENGRAKLVMLVEAQSAWNPNMTLRMLLYLAETYRRYVKDSQQSEHSNSRVKLPKPELYVVYSGNRNVPDEISFKDDFFDGDSPVDLRIKILSRTDETIYGQYIGFCKVYDEQRKQYDNSMRCIEETIRICLEKGYLMAFLSLYKREVVTMMSELFDEQVQREQYDAAIKKAYKDEGIAEGMEKGIAEGMEKGMEKGIAKGVFNTLVSLVKDGLLSIGEASKRANLSISEFEEMTGLSRA